jgi:hypothetical protein
VPVTETPPPLAERLLEVRILEVRGRLARLHAKIAEQCPGEHRYVRHRDNRPPWCDACGYTDVGLHLTEFSVSHGARGVSGRDDDVDELDDEED